jgi:hypothetical protein
LFIADVRAYLDFKPVLLAIENQTKIKIGGKQTTVRNLDCLLDGRAHHVAASDRVVQSESELVCLTARQASAVVELTLIGKCCRLWRGSLQIHRRGRHQGGSNEYTKLFAFHDQQSSKPLKKISSNPVVGAADQNPAISESEGPLE